MTFRVLDVSQRSPEWFTARAGLVTGSCANALTAVRKKGTGELAIRRDLRRRLVVERMTGKPLDEGNGYKSPAMQRGSDMESRAIAAYEAETGQLVTPVGFIQHAELKAGCSPDGYIGAWEGVVEAKCPDATTHLEYRQAGVVPEEYAGQVLHTLWLTGAQWCDFISFDDRFPTWLQLFCVRVKRNDFDVMAYDRTIRAFLEEVETEYQAAIQGVPAAMTG